jgi:hypothetical protein
MQDIVVYIIVALAAGYVIRLAWLSLAGKKGCGGCGSDGCKTKAGAAKATPQIIQIDLNSSFKPHLNGSSAMTPPRKQDHPSPRA